ncbi:MAG: 4Fe-4S dicluster domain-containing protein [Firmicutes bacterium]|nr:4Fe-4S dicluster domain-containing protein [Bacillota bacterium]
MFGKGLLKGMGITWKEFWSEKLTVEYPDKLHPTPERFHGKFTLDVDKCIACSLCANACPNRVITLNKQKVGKKQYLTEYVMDIQYCLFCGLCVEACNKDAIHFSRDFNMNQYFLKDIPLVLVRREAPDEPEEEPEEAAEKPQPKAKAGDGAAKPQPKAEAGDSAEKPQPKAEAGDGAAKPQPKAEAETEAGENQDLTEAAPPDEAPAKEGQ